MRARETDGGTWGRFPTGTGDISFAKRDLGYFGLFGCFIIQMHG